MAGCTQQEDEHAFQEISKVQYLISDTKAPPLASANWQPFQLPLGTRWAQPEQSNLVYWFRAELERPQDAAQIGLYFYRYSKSLDLYFNGEYLGGDSYKSGFDTAAWNHPLLIQIQNSSWQPTHNEVLIRLQTTRLGGVFASFLVGDYQQLQRLQEQRLFQQITLNQWLLNLGVVATLLALLLWFLRRQEPLLWQFAAMSCCWLLVITHLVLYYTPLPDRWWLPLVHVGIDGWIYFLSLFMTNWFGLQRQRQLRWQRYLLVTACAWHLFAPLPAWWMVAYGFHTLGIFCVLLLQYAGIMQMRQQSRRKVLGLMVIVLIQVLCYGHDLYTLVFAPLPTWQTSFHWSQFVFPLLQGIFLVSLLRRFVNALEIAENLNQELEVRVNITREQLQAAYNHAHQIELQKVAEEERIRIYRDLHDDVGSKLLSIVHGSRDSREGGLASAALESLRDAVARANNQDLPFKSFLEELQEEMRLRLQGAGLTLAWSQPVDNLNWILNSDQNYQLTRIFRELVSNIIRHAEASEVEFSVQRMNEQWLFRLQDNGCGFQGALASSGGGSGLHNIRERAILLGSKLEWISRPGKGLLFTLVLVAP